MRAWLALSFFDAGALAKRRPLPAPHLPLAPQAAACSQHDTEPRAGRSAAEQAARQLLAQFRLLGTMLFELFSADYDVRNNTILARRPAMKHEP